MMQQPENIDDGMFTKQELDDLYGTKFAFHQNLPPSYHVECMEVPPEYADEISCVDDKYDHDIEHIMAYQ